MSENQSELRSRADALKRKRDELRESIQTIETQLSDKDRTDSETEQRMNDHDYHEWKKRAVIAQKHMLKDLRAVKAEIAELSEEDHRAKKAADDIRLDRIEQKVDQLVDGLFGRSASNLAVLPLASLVGVRFEDDSHPDGSPFVITSIGNYEADLADGGWYEVQGDEGLLAKLRAGVIRPQKGES